MFGQRIEGFGPHRIRHARPADQILRHLDGAGQLDDFIRAQQAQEVPQTRRIAARDFPTLRQALPPQRAVLAQGFADGVIEVIVEVVARGRESNLRRFDRGEKAGRPNHLQAHAGTGIVHQASQLGQGPGETVAPVAQHPHGGCPGFGPRGTQDAPEQIKVDLIVPLMNPERLQLVVRKVRVGRNEGAFPRLGRGDHLRSVALAELDLRQVADLVFLALEQLEQIGNRRAVDHRLPDEGTALVGDAVDAAVHVVAVGIAEVALQMSDQRVVPVDHVEGSVGAGGGVDGPEIRVLRLHHVGFPRAGESGAVALQLHPKNALETDDVRIEVVAPILFGKMGTGENRAAGGGPRGSRPDLTHAGVFGRKVEFAAERGTKIGVVAGGVGDQVVAPVIEGAAMGIGEGVRHIGLKPGREGLVAVDGAVDVAHDAVDRLDLRPVKHAVAQQDGATRLVDEGVGGVVGVRGVEAHEHALFPVAPAVAVGVAHEPEIRGLHQQDAVLEELEAGRAVQSVEERGARISPSITVGVFEDDDLIGHARGRRELRVAGPDGDPEPAAGVKIHLHRFCQLGELLLAGEEVGFETRGECHEADRLVAINEGIGAVDVRTRLVRAKRGHDRQREHVDGTGLAGGERPDAPLLVGRHDVALRHLLHHDLRIGDLGQIGMGDIRDLGAVTVHIVAVDRAVPPMPERVLLVHSSAQGLGLRGGEVRRGGAHEGRINAGGEPAFAGLVQVHAVDGQGRLRRAGGLGEEFLGRGEEVDKGDAGLVAADFRHRPRVGGEVRLQLRLVLKIRIRVPLDRDRRKDDQARRAKSIVGLLPRFLDEAGQVLTEPGQTFRSGERLVVAEKCKHHIRLHLGQPVVGSAEVLRARPIDHLIAGHREVAHGDLMRGMAGMDHGLEPAMMLHAIRQPVADERHAIVEIELKASPGSRGRRGGGGGAGSDGCCHRNDGQSHRGGRDRGLGCGGRWRGRRRAR